MSLLPSSTLPMRLLSACAVSASSVAGELCTRTAGTVSCSYRTYGSQASGEEKSTGSGRTFRRRPTRYGSKLALRDPERFQRMRTILGYPGPEDAEAAASPASTSAASSKQQQQQHHHHKPVGYVTISLLQTMKHLFQYREVPQDVPQDGRPESVEARRAAARQADNNYMLEGMAAYKVTSLNRQLAPLLDRTEAFLRAAEAEAEVEAGAAARAGAGAAKEAAAGRGGAGGKKASP
ncbi:hypothetical protein HYH02_003305 [Chlamydomonas schloesseri]|uniref:Uncharacterized protein n=1 Tax=Chlamydomonas schloesseri TaxID=2026947 RepID=A0A835WT24_9CHLO|nr:hypothetical protein HYH02_003305 [Chlamydomonas schloesseri]|eukprot:KAG2452281.1 hypothetical protein HYH02_003305 [Chlamydomonas schloesseri]